MNTVFVVLAGIIMCLVSMHQCTSSAGLSASYGFTNFCTACL